MMWEVREGDCLKLLPSVPDASIDLILTDPPYFRVKSLPWDRQWESAEMFIEWIGRLCEQWRRVLKPNGSIYVFASPQMAALVEVEVARWFTVLNHIVWVKGGENAHGQHARACKKLLRSYFPRTERIIFAEHRGADGMALDDSGWANKCEELRGFVFEPLRAYLDGERRRAGISPRQVNDHTSTQMSGHWFTTVQWALPTLNHYAALQRLFNERGRRPAPPWEDYHYVPRERFEPLTADYEHLRADYEHLRRPFAVTSEVPYTDVWEFATVNGFRGKHPCEKPQDLLRHIINSSTRPGAVVLDCFLGSGATGVAARELGRDFIGMEMDPIWVERSRNRIGGGLTLFDAQPNAE